MARTRRKWKDWYMTIWGWRYRIKGTKFYVCNLDPEYDHEERNAYYGYDAKTKTFRDGDYKNHRACHHNLHRADEREAIHKILTNEDFDDDYYINNYKWNGWWWD